MKKFVAIILSVITLLTIGAPALSVSAAESWPSLSKSSYCEFIAEKKINVYCDSACKTSGTSSPKKAYNAYIAQNDVCKIYKITSSYVYLAYPTSSGYKCGYIKRSALFNVSAPSESVKSKGKVTTYKSASTSSEYGYVAKGDKVYKVGTSGNYTRIIYQAASGNRAYKLGYVTTSKYNSSINGNVLVDVTKNFAGKKINIKSVENGMYLCADTDVKNTPIYSNRSASSTWETFTVTKLTEDGWVGLKAAANGKYLSVNNDSDSKPVRATASKVQSWECFRIYQKGSDYYIKAQVNNKWLSVRTDEKNIPVRACVSSASTWERFEISVVNESGSSSNYNAKKAAEYAVEHAYDTPVYNGSDCARYVSECLAVGGITIPNKNLYKAGDYAYSGRKFTGARNPYINAPALLTYLSTKYEVIKNPSVSQMKVGDVAFLVSSDGYEDGHAVMITKISNGIAYYSGHTKAQANQRIYPDNYWTKVRYLVKIS